VAVDALAVSVPGLRASHPDSKVANARALKPRNGDVGARGMLVLLRRFDCRRRW
jgi:hypothetical protein